MICKAENGTKNCFVVVASYSKHHLDGVSMPICSALSTLSTNQILQSVLVHDVMDSTLEVIEMSNFNCQNFFHVFDVCKSENMILK